MSTTPRLHSMPADLERHLGPEGATEYGQLQMMLEESQGYFAPMIVRSDLSESDRRALLNLLAQDLGPTIPLRIVKVSRESGTQFRRSSRPPPRSTGRGSSSSLAWTTRRGSSPCLGNAPPAHPPSPP